MSMAEDIPVNPEAQVFTFRNTFKFGFLQDQIKVWFDEVRAHTQTTIDATVASHAWAKERRGNSMADENHRARDVLEEMPDDLRFHQRHYSFFAPLRDDAPKPEA